MKHPRINTKSVYSKRHAPRLDPSKACWGKHVYTLDTVHQAAAAMHQRAYKCPFCEHWHLATNRIDPARCRRRL